MKQLFTQSWNTTNKLGLTKVNKYCIILALTIAKFGPLREPIRMLLLIVDQFSILTGDMHCTCYGQHKGAVQFLGFSRQKLRNKEISQILAVNKCLNFSSWNHKIVRNNKIVIWWQQKISKTYCRKTGGLQNSSYFFSTCFGSVLKRESCVCTSELPNPVMSLRAVLSTLLTKL